MESPRRDLLVISWCMPPLLLPRSIQVSRTLRELHALGWDMDVFSVSPASLGRTVRLDPALVDRPRQGICHHRLPAGKFRMARLAIRKIVPALAPVPDDEGPWVRKVEGGVEDHLRDKRIKPSAVVSFAQPWSSHLAGLALKRAHGIPWVAHFSDPWADNPYYTRLTRSQSRKMSDQERDVIQVADAIVFTNRQTQIKVMSKYPEAWLAKSFVVPHGYEGAGGVRKPTLNDRLTLCFTGNLYGLRSAAPLVNALGAMNKTRPLKEHIRIQFVGSVKDQAALLAQAVALGVDNLLEFLGNHTVAGANALAAQADVLLLIDAPSNQTSLFLPSKLVEYLQFEKPILGITPVSGAAADLLREMGQTVVDPADIPGIVDALDRLVEGFQNKSLGVTREFRERAKKYDIVHTTQQLDTILQSVMRST